MFFTVPNHQAYADYSIDLSKLPFYSTDTLNLRFLRYGPIDFMLFTEWTHQI